MSTLWQAMNVFLLAIMLMIFSCSSSNNDIDLSAIELLKQHNVSSIGIKILPTTVGLTTSHESDITLGIQIPGISMYCPLTQIVATEWPYIWSWCDMTSSLTNICHDDSITNYSIYIQNPSTSQSLIIDTIKLLTTHESEALWIEHWLISCIC